MFDHFLLPSTTPSDRQPFRLAFMLILLKTSGFEFGPLLGFEHELFVFEHEAPLSLSLDITPRPSPLITPSFAVSSSSPPRSRL
ncbi:hypothetical protein K525DRAFT_275775 [Schizophyllum commune Loenen D]|nr:hypothetical protein K525DRAFT_275775 [Schizophyllum commune Loenen D]